MTRKHRRGEVMEPGLRDTVLLHLMVRTDLDLPRDDDDGACGYLAMVDDEMNAYRARNTTMEIATK